MAHPTSILRGRVLTLPIELDNDRDPGIVEQTTARLQQDLADEHVLVTFSEPKTDTLRVLTVSGEAERSVGEWQSLIESALAVLGRVRWDLALVQMPSPRHARE